VSLSPSDLVTLFQPALLIVPTCTELLCSHLRWTSLFPPKLNVFVPTWTERLCSHLNWTSLFPPELNVFVPTWTERLCSHLNYVFCFSLKCVSFCLNCATLFHPPEVYVFVPAWSVTLFQPKLWLCFGLNYVSLSPSDLCVIVSAWFTYLFRPLPPSEQCDFVSAWITCLCSREELQHHHHREHVSPSNRDIQ
jgi:hypothetical protein